MKTQKAIFIFIITCFIAVSCKQEIKKEQVSLTISGMTCEIGCARTIQSKLTKKEGVVDAKVDFKNKTATIEYDANTTNKEDLKAFIESVGDGKTYKCDTKNDGTKKKACSIDCKKDCCEGKVACKCDGECKKKCDTKDKESKTCKADCKMDCCKNNEKKACSANCEKACCA